MKERQETCAVKWQIQLHINLPKNQQQKSVNIWPKPKSRANVSQPPFLTGNLLALCYPSIPIQGIIGRSSCNRVVIIETV